MKKSMLVIFCLLVVSFMFMNCSGSGKGEGSAKADLDCRVEVSADLKAEAALKPVIDLQAKLEEAHKAFLEAYAALNSIKIEGKVEAKAEAGAAAKIPTMKEVKERLAKIRGAIKGAIKVEIDLNFKAEASAEAKGEAKGEAATGKGAKGSSKGSAKADAKAEASAGIKITIDESANGNIKAEIEKLKVFFVGYYKASAKLFVVVQGLDKTVKAATDFLKTIKDFKKMAAAADLSSTLTSLAGRLKGMINFNMEMKASMEASASGEAKAG